MVESSEEEKVRQAKKEVIKLSEELQRRKSRRQLYSLYPSKGPLRRELYVPHVSFFDAGKDKRERCIIAANRIGKCVTSDTYIDTPNGKILMSELYKKGEPFDVFAWDGYKKVIAKASAPFKKPKKEPCIRVKMSDGETIGIARKHLVLSRNGWLFASDIFLSPMQQVFFYFRKIRCAFSRLVRGLDVFRLFEKQLNCFDRCFVGCRQGGGQPLPVKEIDQFFSQQLACVPKRISLSYNMDGTDYRHTNIDQQVFSHLPNSDDSLRVLDRFFGFASQVFCTPYRLYLYLLQRVQRLSIVEGIGFLLDLLVSQYQDVSSSLANSPVRIDDNHIVSYNSIGCQDVYDFAVRKYHNYCAGGMIHHNSFGIGGYETALHLTGLYPDWWTGRRFKTAVNCWAAGDTSQTVRDIAQEILLGPPHAHGTGLIPGDLVSDVKRKPGNVPDAVEQIMVKHRSGGISRLVFKSYDQKRKSFQGTAQHVIWLDEECPMDIYGECLLRTMTTSGLILLTFTPLMGLTEVVLNFMPSGKMPDGGVHGSKYIVNATWDDAPHLTEQQKEEIISGTPPYLRGARAKGIPQLGAGAIYPILEEDVIIDDFIIPPWYPRAYALDIGWNCTAATWGAWNREDDIVYIYSVHKQGHAEPSTHVDAINARGEWIPGVIDPASKGRSQLDGKKLIDKYNDLGLELSYADNALEAGIFSVWQRLVSGRLKIFRSLTPWLNEFRIYRRAESGKVARDQDDHLMDCTRYFIMTGLNIVVPPPYDEEEIYFDEQNSRIGKKKRLSIYGIH